MQGLHKDGAAVVSSEFGISQTWIQVPAMPIASRVTLTKPQILCYKSEMIKKKSTISHYFGEDEVR